jgi:general secretion pathway protein D
MAGQNSLAGSASTAGKEMTAMPPRHAPRSAGVRRGALAAAMLCFLAMTAAAPLSSAAVGAAQIGSASDKDSVTLNFVNADIDSVVKVMSEMTGKNFVIDPRVKGTVNIVSAKPLSKSLAYEVFLSALRLQGVAAIEENGIVKIIPESDAKIHQSPLLAPGAKPRASGDHIQTQVFTLKYESALQMVPILRPLIAPNNTITAYPNSNSLVITDYASNLQRIDKIIASIDQPSGSEPILIPLRHASALDVAQTVNRLFDEAQAQGSVRAEPAQRVTVVADARSNSLVARSDNPSRLTRLRNLVAMLDAPTSAAGNIHVVYLKNAEAVKVAETLRAIALTESASPARAASALPPPPISAPGRLPTSVLAAPQPPPGVSPSPPPLYAPPGMSSWETAPPPPAPGMVQADPATNSIIINAPDAIYNNLRAVLEKLDVRRAQVYVEALIAEVTADRAAEFGIQWQDLSGAAATGTRVFGGTNFGTASQNILGLSQSPVQAGRGLNIGVIRGRVTIPGVGEVLNLGLLVRALESDSNANILSTPTLLTLDNEEARIVIGQNVPFITGQYALSGAATTPTPFQTIERRDVGLTLRIKPQISEGGTVRLQIYQEVSSIQDRTNIAGVITNKRAVESTVLVDDGQIIVIGGLIQDSVNSSLEKVPVLGDIPVLGGLFQYNARSRSKTNLLVFLRPTVLREGQRADPLTSDRYEYILRERTHAVPPPHPVLPDLGVSSLPLPLRLSPLPSDIPASGDAPR